MTDVGKNIRTLREAKGLTQEQLAQMLYVTRQTISNYEMGKSKPDVDMIRNIARVLDTDANTLLYGPPDFQRKRMAWKGFGVGAVFCLGLFVAYGQAVPWAQEVAWTRYTMFPYLFLRLIVLPCAMFALGWTIMQGVCCLLGVDLERGERSYTIPLRIVLWIALVVVALLLVPYAVWLMAEWIGAGSGSFPHIPLYTPLVNAFMMRWGQAPYLAWGLGVAFWWAGNSLRISHKVEKESPKLCDGDMLPL